MASGVVYYDTDGTEQFQPAEVVIVACNGIGTPRILLNSASSRFPNGLANSSGLPNDDSALTANENRSLRCVAEMMIPASAAHSVPGADDDMIFADIVNSIGRDATLVKQAPQHLDALVGGVFADVDPTRRQAAAAAIRDAGGEPLMALTRVFVQCYYRDGCVMRSLGMEEAAVEVEQDDWSLLDPVRKRPAFYRHTP